MATGGGIDIKISKLVSFRPAGLDYMMTRLRNIRSLQDHNQHLSGTTFPSARNSSFAGVARLDASRAVVQPAFPACPFPPGLLVSAGEGKPQKRNWSRTMSAFILLPQFEWGKGPRPRKAVRQITPPSR